MKRLFLSFFPLFLFVAETDTLAKCTGNTQFVANDSMTVYSAPPKLLTGLDLEYPALLLKQGIEGTISIKVGIDQCGEVEYCIFNEQLHPLLDSLLEASLKKSRFSPAFDSGETVKSELDLEFSFNLDTIAVSSYNAIADIQGVVLDKITKKPVSGAMVNVQIEDWTKDPDLKISRERYLNLLGNVPGQKKLKGFISTRTDSQGHFAFKLLPNCPVKLAILAEGYQVANVCESIKPNRSVKMECIIEPFADDTVLNDSTHEIVSYGYINRRSEIDLEKKQVEIGLTHFLSKIIISDPAVQQVPEAGSALLVRSGTPFDNRYLISGVPFFAPFHFAGFPFADFDGVMISALQKITMSIDNIAGRYLDASGALIKVNPEIIRNPNKKLKKRPELNVDFGSTEQDFLLSFPVNRKKENYLELGFTRSEDYSLKFLKVQSHLGDKVIYGEGFPSTFGNVTINGTFNGRKLNYGTFGWISWDAYDGKLFPWGMTSLRIRPINNSNVSFTAGGSHQYFLSGKRVAYNLFSKKVDYSNIVASVIVDSINPGKLFQLSSDLQVEGMQWKGSVNQKDYAGLDSSYTASGEEVTTQMHLYAGKNLGYLNVKTNILFAGIYYGPAYDFIVDPGFSIQYHKERVSAELHMGRVTSRPDIRGLPDDYVRRELLHSYLLSGRFEFINPRLKMDIQPYLRFMDRYPGFDTLLSVWNSKKLTSVNAKGIDGTSELQLFKWISITCKGHLSDSKRNIVNGDSAFEWNIPWSITGGIHLSFYDRLFFYIDIIKSHGLPYYDYNTCRYEYLPNYRNIDIGLQIRNLNIKHRFLTRFDAYIDAKNPLRIKNIRDYFWDINMNKQPVLLGSMYFDFGVRLNFRL